MNLGPGGKQPRMRQGYMRDGTPQEMNLAVGTPKGMKIILEERGLWRSGLRKACLECTKNTKGR